MFDCGVHISSWMTNHGLKLTLHITIYLSSYLSLVPNGTKCHARLNE